MKTFVLTGIMLVGASAALTQAPAGAPAGANGICKDGTYSMSASKAGACRGHQGVGTWYAAALAKSTPAVPPATAAPIAPAKAAAAVPPAAKPAAMPAQASSAIPPGANGICKDGTYSMSATKAGACRGHNGVQTWYASPAAAPTPAAKPAVMPAPASAATKSAAMPAPVPAAAPATASATGKRLSPQEAAAQKTAAPGGGKGLVWVNTASNVYHCTDDAFYGKTKAGAYMSEDAAKAKGAHGDRGKSCAGK
jgi:hypothetical protein